jgi:protein SCO1/2
MPAMTMELTVRDPNELKGIKGGDTVTFRILADDDKHWIDSIKVVALGKSTEPASPTKASHSSGELKRGDPIPDVALIGETGNEVWLSSFRGKALAITFIFTRCPLPDFCPLMGRNFASARRNLAADSNGPTNWQFLSISFDADFDKPAVLSRYAKNYRGEKADRWLFAAADAAALSHLAGPLDLMVNRDGGSISHNLRTIVIDPSGRIHRQLDGNDWKADELVRAIREACASNASGSPQAKPHL